MKKIKSFILHYNPKFSSNSILLESHREGNDDEGRSFEYTEKDGIVRADYKSWGWIKGYYTHEGHKFNHIFHELPKDKWVRDSSNSSVKFGNGEAKITDIVYE